MTAERFLALVETENRLKPRTTRAGSSVAVACSAIASSVWYYNRRS